MNKHTVWAWTLKNSTVMVCWTILAIHFDKWWIILFAALFVSGLETKYRSYRVCDKCGKHSPHADSYNEALDKAKEAGWIHIVEGNKDYCPECQKGE